MTVHTYVVLGVLLRDGGRELHGAAIAEEAGLLTGTVYPILGRLAEAGWLVDRWEDIDPRVEGRPRRRFYRLSVEGAASARAVLARWSPPALPERSGSG